ncbi:hypothetical protein ABT354_26900 [Streptomyces sp. NPDC000594]|uniref:hypothetical protein n=1 Tax=Streptomyces sp. NPDC000594 TaxID=3154261 RepID=UPI00331F93CD
MRLPHPPSAPHPPRLPRPAAVTVLTALTALTAALLAGCGVRPTTVLDGGDAAGGLTKGIRIYFVSSTGRLEAVSRPEHDVSAVADPAGVLKLLGAGPTREERAAGLTTLVTSEGYETGYRAALDADGGVTVDVPQPELSPDSLAGRRQLGQLVCSMARGRALADRSGTRRTDDIEVTVRASDAKPRTYVCSDLIG